MTKPSQAAILFIAQNNVSGNYSQMIPKRFLILAAGLTGASGVALSAAAAHQGIANLSTAASFLMIHAPAFLALSLLNGNKVHTIGSWTLFVGLVFFTGDLLSRAYIGTRFFPMAAPSGGVLMIGGWLVIAVSVLFKTSEPNH